MQSYQPWNDKNWPGNGEDYASKAQEENARWSDLYDILCYDMLCPRQILKLSIKFRWLGRINLVRCMRLPKMQEEWFINFGPVLPNVLISDIEYIVRDKTFLIELGHEDMLDAPSEEVEFDILRRVLSDNWVLCRHGSPHTVEDKYSFIGEYRQANEVRLYNEARPEGAKQVDYVTFHQIESEENLSIWYARPHTDPKPGPAHEEPPF